MTNWKKNLLFVWLSQFMSIMGFSFAMPFVPYYMQELGVTDPLKLKLWIAAFTATAPLSLAVCAPLWGWVADRYGRRIMLLRANLGAAVFLALMGSVGSVGMLVLMRTMQGVLTGTMTAAQAMVASHAPREKSGFAMGALSSGVFSGAMAGLALGGVFADAFGYRNAFFAASGLLVMASLFVVFGTSERFERPPASDAAGEAPPRRKLGLALIVPMILPIGLVSLLRRFDLPYLSLLVQDIHGALEGASTRMGALNAVACVAGFLSGLAFGHLADRLPASRLARWGALGGGLLMLPQAFISSFPPLFALRFAAAFCLGGLEPVFHSWLAKTTPHRERGVVFGWGATARALGWGMAPLLSGLVASTMGVRAVFAVGGVLLASFSILLPRLVGNTADAGTSVSG